MLRYDISRATTGVSNRAPRVCYPCVSPHASHSLGLSKPTVTQKTLQSTHEEAMEVSNFSLWPVCLSELSLIQITLVNKGKVTNLIPVFSIPSIDITMCIKSHFYTLNFKKNSALSQFRVLLVLP
jgi:hypothetical protein